jgi:DNA modification methylase
MRHDVFPDYKIIETSSLIPYARNSRVHDDQQVNQIAASINEFGFLNPIIIDGENGIIAGHGRVLAASKLAIDRLPCIEAKHLTDAQRQAYVIADNKIAINSEWDNDMLRIELSELSEIGFDIELTGFSIDEFAGLQINEIPGGGLTDDDSIPEIPELPNTVRGDVWILGNHRLMCGDSTSVDDVDNLMAGGIADMVHTDPPYGVEYQSNMRTKTAKFDQLKNDDGFLDIAPIVESFSSGWVFIWTSWKVLTKWIDQFSTFGYPTNQVIWYKPGGGIGDLKKTFASDYETALVWHRGAELTGKRIGSVWKVNKDGATKYVHPTQKPVALAEEAIDKTTKQGDKILDLFGGSGSTLIACEKTGRKAFIMELDEKYCDVIIKRWQEYTGKRAVHADTGDKFSEESHG